MVLAILDSLVFYKYTYNKNDSPKMQKISYSNCVTVVVIENSKPGTRLKIVKRHEVVDVGHNCAEIIA